MPERDPAPELEFCTPACPMCGDDTEADGDGFACHRCGPVFAAGETIGNHYWLDPKSDPPTYHWDGTEWREAGN